MESRTGQAFLVSLVSFVFLILAREQNQIMASNDEIYTHMSIMEGNEKQGYIPSAGSGVTIGIGVDLLHQSAAALRAKGVPDALVRKLEGFNFFGKNKAQIQAEGLNPKSLTLDETELEQLNAPMINELRPIAAEYGVKMCDKGKACLASLRHWAGRLGNTNPGKLARRMPDNSVKNFVWDTIKNKTATTEDLRKALEETLKTYDQTKTPLNYRTITREINYLKGVPNY